MNDYVKETKNFCDETGTDIDFKYMGQVCDPWKCGMNTLHDQYQVVITRNGIWHTFNFTQSAHATENGEEPTEYDVLACLTKFEPGEYWDWCNEYGMENSEDSWNTWKECVKEWRKVYDLFHDVMEEFQMIA